MRAVRGEGGGTGGVAAGLRGATRTVSGIELASAGGSIPLATAPAKLRCARCGKKEARMVVLSPLGVGSARTRVRAKLRDCTDYILV